MKITSPWRLLRLLIALALIGGLFLWWSVSGAPLEKGGQLVVEQGTAATPLWQQAVDQGFTSGTLAWRYQAWRQQAGAGIQAGSYEVNAGESVSDAVRRLLTGDTRQDELTLTFPEGFTLEQMAERTAARGIGTVAAFKAAAVPANFVEAFPFLVDIPAGRDLEGYLFPDTYRVFIDDEPTHVIRRMLATFEQKGLAGLERDDTRTLDQLVIMASIIEREVQTDDDMALVSGVLWSRFDDGAGLDADATVRYALDKPTEALTVQDLNDASPYNTRRFRGLPPGPISNPGSRALQAAAEPEDSDYYYYLNAPSGETIFSKTNDEHNVNKAKYLR